MKPSSLAKITMPAAAEEPNAFMLSWIIREEILMNNACIPAGIDRRTISLRSDMDRRSRCRVRA